MWNWLGRLLFPGVHHTKDFLYAANSRMIEECAHYTSRCAAIHKSLALKDQELACFRDNAAHSEALILDLDVYITQCEGQTLYYKNELRSLAYASDETIERETKHYAKNRDECIGEVARLKRMMAREQARVYELGAANDELVKRLKGKAAGTLRRPEVHLGMGTYSTAQTRAADAAEDKRYNKQTGEL